MRLIRRVLLRLQYGLLIEGRSELFFLLIMLLLSACLRFWGIGWGLPHLYHYDAPIVVGTAVRMAKSHTLNVMTVSDMQSTTLFTYITLALYGVAYVVGRLFSLFSSVTDFELLYFSDRTIFYLLPRVVTATFSTLTVPLVYIFTKDIISKRAAVIATIFTCFCLFLVKEAHYVKHDSMLIFFFLLSHWFAVSVARRGVRKDYVYSGIAVGLAMASKYNGAIAILPVAVATVLRNWRGDRPYRRAILSLFSAKLWMCGAIALIVFALVNPFPFLHPKAFYEFVREWLLLPAREGWAGVPESGWVFYTHALYHGVGLPLILMALAGLVWAVVRPTRDTALLLCLPVVYYLCAGRAQTGWFPRFILPVAPYMAILAASFIDRCVQMCERNKFFKEVSAHVLAATLCAVCVVMPALRCLKHDWLLNQKDTQILAKEWIETNIPSGARLAHYTQFYRILTPSRQRLTELFEKTPDKIYNRGLWLQSLSEEEYPKPSYYLLWMQWAADDQIEELMRGNYQYVVLEHYLVDAVRKRRLSSLREKQDRLLDYVRTNGKLIKAISPSKDWAKECPEAYMFNLVTPMVHLDKLRLPGPLVEIYEIKQVNKGV